MENHKIVAYSFLIGLSFGIIVATAFGTTFLWIMISCFVGFIAGVYIDKFSYINDKLKSNDEANDDDDNEDDEYDDDDDNS